MPQNAYLTLTGQKQGQIKGTVTAPAPAGSILVHGYSHQVLEPRDPQSGLPSGKVQHQPLLITKQVDSASPKLFLALTTNENFPTLQLQFWEAAVTGAASAASKQTYTITLTNAVIVSIQQSLPDNTSAASALTEQLSFTYQKITWTWNDGGITATDDWETPNV